MKKLLPLAAPVLLAACLAAAADLPALEPSTRDKCPVCGMFTAKFPDFLSGIKFRDGSSLYFDGAKDLFKYLQNMSRYTPGKNAADITAITVKDYYSLSPVDGRRAFYVAGSNVYGPMGHELIPFGSEKEAREFLKDHKGKRVLSFEQITPAVVKDLE